MRIDLTFVDSVDIFLQVADLPPVTDEQFREKVLAYKAQTEAQAKEDEENSSLYCACCKKNLKSKNAYDNHIISKKHKEMEKQESQPKKGPKQPRKVKVYITSDNFF